MDLANSMELFAVSVAFQFAATLGSLGDRHENFLNCWKFCMADNCTLNHQSYYESQPLGLWLTFWSCDDDCKYFCMWSLVAEFQAENFTIPQFYGKWPFIRYAGIQEPASVLFSILNLVGFCFLLTNVRKFVSPQAPMYFVWQLYSWFGINAWIWSSIFHTRDLAWTEKMDYFCAFSAVLCSFFTCLVRIFGSDKPWKVVGFALPLVAYFTYHVWYLTAQKFDYGYNMRANVAVGITNSIGWLLLCGYEWAFKRRGYFGYAAAVIIIANCLLLFELYDFPPIFWTLDAHALWHAGTAPLPLIWARFVIADCRQMLEDSKKKIEKILIFIYLLYNKFYLPPTIQYILHCKISFLLYCTVQWLVYCTVLYNTAINCLFIQVQKQIGCSL